MSRIFRDSSVLNQNGSPSINSNTLSNRPTFGQPGRLFVSTDTLAIYRDTGSAWDNLTDNPGNIGTLQEVTTNGSRSNQNIFLGPDSVTPTNTTLDVYGYSLIRNTVNSGTNLGPIFYSQYSINYNGTNLSGFANSIFAQDIYNVTANTTIQSSTQSGTSLNVNTYKFTTASTITLSQPGGTIRAASCLTCYSQFQNTAAGTITHAAGIAILGIENLGGSALTINNNYQLLINASDEFASTATVTNRWGIYQNGANDYNYFAGGMSIGTTNKFTGYDLVTNNMYIGSFLNCLNSTFGAVQTNDLKSSNGNLTFTKFDYSSIIGTWYNTGNLRIGTGADTGRKLQVNGEAEFIVTVGTGAHTTSGNHLPIWVNNVQYWIALLNPVIP